jgi:hypothetical protein
MARAQFDLLSGLGEIDILRMPATALKSEIDPLIAAGLERALAQGRDLAITTDLHGSLSHRHGADPMESLGRMLRPFLRKFGAVVLTGGETARALLSQSEIGRSKCWVWKTSTLPWACRSSEHAYYPFVLLRKERLLRLFVWLTPRSFRDVERART